MDPDSTPRKPSPTARATQAAGRGLQLTQQGAKTVWNHRPRPVPFWDHIIVKRLKKDIDGDPDILVEIWPDEDTPRPVLKRTATSAFALRMWGVAWSLIIALWVTPILAFVWLAAVHAATVATRNYLTWKARDEKISRRANGRYVLIAELAAGAAIFIGALVAGLDAESTLKIAMLAYIAILGLLALNLWLDNYILVATDGTLVRHTGILWFETNITTPLADAEAGEYKTYLPGWLSRLLPRIAAVLGKLTIDVKLIQADEQFHDIFPLSDPAQFRRLLIRLQRRFQQQRAADNNAA